MKLTIATITARKEPRYEWLVNALALQSTPLDEIEIVIVDCYNRELAALVSPDTAIPPQVSFVISPPKPNPWQGEHRVTSRDLHAIANARNTAICLASHDYVAFVDDRCRPRSRWLAEIRKGHAAYVSAASEGNDEANTYALCGPCDKDRDGERNVADDRRGLLPGNERCDGDWFYGGNFALPLAWLLTINGCEEATDPVGRQDRVMGRMLENAGYRLKFALDMAVLLDRTGQSSGHPFPRVDPNGRKKRILLERFGKLSRTDPATTPDLTAIRAQLAAGEPFPMHSFTPESTDWYTNEPLGTM